MPKREEDRDAGDFRPPFALQGDRPRLKLEPINARRARPADRLLDRLRVRLVSGLLLTGLLLGLLVGRFFHADRVARLEAELRADARLQSLALGARVVRLGDIAAQIASRTRIREELARYLDGAIDLDRLRAFSRPKLAEAMKAAPQVRGILRLGPAGEPLIAVGEALPRAWWPHPLPQHRPVYGPVFEQGDQVRVIVAAPLRDGEGRLLGTDLVSFDAADLARSMDLFVRLQHDQGVAVLAARHHGRLLWFLRRGSDPTADPDLEALLRREVEEELDNLDEGVHGVRAGRLSMVGFHTKIGASGWVFLELVPAELFYAPARQAALQAGGAVLLLALLGVGLSLWAGRPLVRRLAADHAARERLLGENRRLLERVQRSEEQFRNLVETSRDWFWEVDRQWRYTYVSPRCRDLLGQEPEALLGKTPFELMPAEEAGRVFEILEGLAARQAPVDNLVHQACHADGRTLVLETSALPHFDHRGRLAGYRGTDRDVTERRRAEEELRASEESYRGLFHSVLDAIFIQRTDGRFLDVNPAVEAMFGRPRDWFVGRRPRDFEVPERNERAQVERAWNEALAGRPQRFEYWARRGDGEIFPMEVVLNRGRYRGEPVVIAVARDMSEQHERARRLARAGREWTLAMDQFDQAVCLLDPGGRLQRANRAFWQLTGLVAETALGRPLDELLTPCPLEAALQAHRDHTRILEPEDRENPTDKPLEACLRVLRDPDGGEAGLLLSLRDLTASRLIEERLRLAASVFENTDEGVVITDARGRIVEVNPAFTEILGYVREEVIGRTPALWRSNRHDRPFYREIFRALRRQGFWRGEIWSRRRNGEVFPQWLTISSITDARGRVTHYVGVFSDISQIKHSQAQLDHLAHHDPLTGLPNRLLLRERLDQAIRHAHRTGTQVAVLFLDLDRFKHINDSLGHPAGDRLLQEVGRKLRASLREDDTVARIGGDEFVIVLQEIEGLEQVVQVAEKLRALFAAPVALDDHQVRVTASIGIALHPRDGTDPETLLRNADAAMYRTKEQGRDAFHFYTEALTRKAMERVLLENALREAIEHDQLELVYQPQVDLADGRLLGAEALLRWHHPEFGEVPPARFVPVAEESGLIHALGDWVLRRACAQGRAWLDQGLDFGRLAVNIAGPQLQRPGLVERVQAVLDETGLPPTRLELEVTESFIMQQGDPAVARLRALRELGITLAIDDFGTGHSSLAYLKQLPVNRLKIDRSFVRDLPDDANDLAIARAIIALGRSLGLTILAEGVEQARQARVLREAGCHQAQGYHFGRPMAPQALAARLVARP